MKIEVTYADRVAAHPFKQFCPDQAALDLAFARHRTRNDAQVAALVEALRPFALAAQKGSNVYVGVQMAMKDRPDLFSYSTAYIDAGRSTAHAHLSWSDYSAAMDAYKAFGGQQ